MRPAWFTTASGIAERDGRGFAGSLLLHGLVALLVLVFLVRSMTGPKRFVPPRMVPVEVIRLGEETTAPPSPLKAKIPQPVARHVVQREPKSANRPVGVSPRATKPLDELETRLHALARLKQPESNIKPIETPSGADTPATSADAAPGRDAMYAVRDLIRSQVERKWTFDMSELGTGTFAIALRIVVLKDGRVAKADIVDKARYAIDPAFRDLALSARNAVLLSSPLTLPNNSFGDQMTLTLTLNPRETLR